MPCEHTAGEDHRKGGHNLQGIRMRFHALAEDDTSGSPSMQEISAKIAADTAVRATANTNRLGHGRLEPLTPLLFASLLTLLCLPSIMPPLAVMDLFRDVSAGNIRQPSDIRAAFEPFMKPVAETHCEKTAEELKLVELVLKTRNAPKSDAAGGISDGNGSDGKAGSGGEGTADPVAAPEVVNAAKIGLCLKLHLFFCSQAA